MCLFYKRSWEKKIQWECVLHIWLIIETLSFCESVTLIPRFKPTSITNYRKTFLEFPLRMNQRDTLPRFKVTLSPTRLFYSRIFYLSPPHLSHSFSISENKFFFFWMFKKKLPASPLLFDNVLTWMHTAGISVWHWETCS